MCHHLKRALSNEVSKEEKLFTDTLYVWLSLYRVGAWGERVYSSYSFTTSASGEWSASHPDRALPPGKGPPVPIVGGPQSRSGHRG
jgi:hypothetical protein